MLPIVTNLGMSVSGLIGGAVVIEQIFNWNGMGTLFLNANNTNDYPRGCWRLGESPFSTRWVTSYGS